MGAIEMKPDKTDLWKKWAVYPHADGSWLMTEEDFLAALSEAEGERWISVEEKLLAALKGVLELIEDGTLVRDVSEDADRAWALKAAKLISRLGVAKQAVAAAEMLNPAHPKEKP